MITASSWRIHGTKRRQLVSRLRQKQSQRRHSRTPHKPDQSEAPASSGILPEGSSNSSPRFILRLEGYSCRPILNGLILRLILVKILPFGYPCSYVLEREDFHRRLALDRTIGLGNGGNCRLCGYLPGASIHHSLGIDGENAAGRRLLAGR